MGEYLQEAVLPVQYDNYVFDLYGEEHETELYSLFFFHHV